MGEGGYAEKRGGGGGGTAHEAAFGEEETGAFPAQDEKALNQSGGDAEQIDNVAQRDIAAQFAGGYGDVSNALGRDEFAFDTPLRADPEYVPAGGLKAVYHRKSGENMTGGAPAGEYGCTSDFRHGSAGRLSDGCSRGNPGGVKNMGELGLEPRTSGV